MITLSLKLISLNDIEKSNNRIKKIRLMIGKNYGLPDKMFGSKYYKIERQINYDWEVIDENGCSYLVPIEYVDKYKLDINSKRKSAQ